MASNDYLIKESVLLPALANAALLIAAPNIGNLRTYTNVFKDLCRAYSLHVPDLAHVLNYSPMASSSAMMSSSKMDSFQKATKVTPDSQELEIKKEPEDPEYETVKVKHKIANNKGLYNACLYDTKPTNQGTSSMKLVEIEGIQLEMPLDIALDDIPLNRKDNSQVYYTKPSTQCISFEKHVNSKDAKVETIFNCALDKMVPPIKDKDISKVSLTDHVCTKGQGTSQMMAAPNESQPKIHLLQEKISKDNIQFEKTDPYATMVRCTSKSLNSLATNVYSFLDSTGRKHYASSSEYSRHIQGLYGMPFNYAINNIDFKDCLVHVDTIVEGPSRPSTLHIWLKDEDKEFIIPFVNILEISKYENSINICYYSKLNKCIEIIYLRIQGTNERHKKMNITATIEWLHTFLG